MSHNMSSAYLNHLVWRTESVIAIHTAFTISSYGEHNVFQLVFMRGSEGGEDSVFSGHHISQKAIFIHHVEFSVKVAWSWFLYFVGDRSDNDIGSLLATSKNVKDERFYWV